MDLLMDFQKLVKSKIRFATADGDYEGVVRLVCPVTRKIIIEQLLFLPKQLFIGVLHFNISEILSHKLISQTQVHVKEELPVFNMIHTKNTELSSEMVSEDLPKEERYILKLPQWPNVILPTDSVILDCINEQFHQAIAHIQQQGNIGVFLGGPGIGRDGILSWLSITTPICIFLFDIQTLNEKTFPKGGLKDVLENPRIEKILHDCRNASDCLYHKFNTKLINVFDTQVADLFVTLQSNKKGTTLRKVNTLNFCLAKYLDVPNSFLPKNKHRSYVESVLHYSLRPLRNETRDLLIKSVIYLRFLKQRLNRLLFNPFHRAVEVYLQVVQSASDQELLLEPLSEVEIPLQLVMDRLQTVRFRDSSSENYTNLYKSNSGKNITMDTSSSSGFSKLFYQNEVNLAAGHISPNVENRNDLCDGNKYNAVKDYFIDNDNSTNFCKLPQVNIATYHMQHKLRLSDNIKLSTVNSSDCSSVDESLFQNDINVPHRQFEYKNTETLGHSCTGGINNSSDMKSKQNLYNSDSSNKSREMSNKDKFRLSRLKFNNGSICQVKQEHVTSNGDNNPKVKMNNFKTTYTKSTPLSKNNFFNERGKSKESSNLGGDPYAKLREAFYVPYDTNEEKKKELKFFPAGMANIS